MKYQVSKYTNSTNSISIRIEDINIPEQSLALYYHNETNNIVKIYYHYSFYSDAFYDREKQLTQVLNSQDDIVSLLLTCASMVLI